MPERWTVRRRRAAALVPATAIGLALLLGWPVGTTLAGPSPARTTVGVSTPDLSATFPSRAGFSAAEVHDTTGIGPLTGSVRVDVVFSPRTTASSSATRAPSSAAAYGLSAGMTTARYASAERYFEAAGLSVAHAWPDRLVLSLDGDAAAVDRAFHTREQAGTYEGRPVHFPATPPSLPPTIEPWVAGVVGLSDGFSPFSFSLSPPVPLQVHGAAGLAITPSNARAVYNVTNLLQNVTATPTYPTSEAIALILWGAGYDPNDTSAFFSGEFPAGYPAPTVVPTPIDGAPMPSAAALSSSDLATVQELTLDIEWSGALAPGATIYPVYPPGESVAELTDALEKALSLPRVVAISMSFGAPESGASALNASWWPLLQEATARGITVLAASGDFGGDANASCTGGVAPEYPATSPAVLAVGGTALTQNGSLLSGPVWSEAAWSGSGGGFSAVNSAPAWQKVGTAGTAVNDSGGGRGIPDVSATSLNDYLYFQGKAQAADGTSFATPLWAGIVADLDAVIGTPLGFLTPRLYHDASNQRPGPDQGVVDITGGGNCVARAGAGWDAVTGWGSPRASNLYYELVGSFVNLSLATSPSTLAPGGSVSVRVAATNWTNGRPIAELSMVVAVASDTSYGPCVGTFGRTTVTTNSTGWATAGLSVPACYLGSHAIVTASVQTSRLFGQSSVHVAVNLLGFVPALEGLANPPYSYLLYAGIMGIAVVTGGMLGRRRRPSMPAAVRSAVLPPSEPPAAGPPAASTSTAPPRPPTATAPQVGGPDSGQGS